MSNSPDFQSQISSKTIPFSQTDPSFRDINNNQNDPQATHRQTPLPMTDKHVTPRSSQAMSILNSNMNKLRDPLRPQPYDPIGGFVIFFDFILNLPSTIELCYLITSIHHPKSELGEPSYLEPVKCEQYRVEGNDERMNVALIATKQPVPRYIIR